MGKGVVGKTYVLMSVPNNQEEQVSGCKLIPGYQICEEHRSVGVLCLGRGVVRLHDQVLRKRNPTSLALGPHGLQSTAQNITKNT